MLPEPRTAREAVKIIVESNIDFCNTTFELYQTADGLVHVAWCLHYASSIPEEITAEEFFSNYDQHACNVCERGYFSLNFRRGVGKQANLYGAYVESHLLSTQSEERIASMSFEEGYLLLTELENANPFFLEEVYHAAGFKTLDSIDEIRAAVVNHLITNSLPEIHQHLKASLNQKDPLKLKTTELWEAAEEAGELDLLKKLLNKISAASSGKFLLVDINDSFFVETSATYLLTKAFAQVYSSTSTCWQLPWDCRPTLGYLNAKVGNYPFIEIPAKLSESEMLTFSSLYRDAINKEDDYDDKPITQLQELMRSAYRSTMALK